MQRALPTCGIGATGSVDVVISRHLLWTLSDPPRALSSWQDLLRPGGLLLVIDGLWWAGGVDPADVVDAVPGLRETGQHQPGGATPVSSGPERSVRHESPVVRGHRTAARSCRPG
ncbi:MAG: methyltransferase domain-containing protein [Chloroflexi bacterium]|nr:methyltransferase domain-containing protein [Chloroflexota bacterium]